MAKDISPPQLLRGMKDLLPADQPYWEWVRTTLQRLAFIYGFERLDTPMMEATSLFQRSVGDLTDIVSKEMYTFTDKSGDSVSLRPEGTAGAVRAYIEHGMLNMPQPVKMWYFGPFFRHDRPQAGRYRQFWQYGFEVLGAPQPIIEAQLILLARAFYRTFGLDVSIQLNSIGDKQDRVQYIKALQTYFRTKKSELTEDHRLLLQKNPLRLLDSKDPVVQALLADAPQIIDFLSDESRQHFQEVVGYLDELEVTFMLNPRLVRGLDYYNRTVFEFWAADDEQGHTSLGGGGRYDGLVELLGGRPTPAAGMAGGIERLIQRVKDAQTALPAAERPQVYLAQLGEPARKKALKLFEQLRDEGVVVAESFIKDGLKQQLEVANKLGAHYTLIIGQKEMMDDTILFRDMENGIQEIVDFKKTISEVKKRLEKTKANGTVPAPTAVAPERDTLLPTGNTAPPPTPPDIDEEQ